MGKGDLEAVDGVLAEKGYMILANAGNIKPKTLNPKP